MIYKSIVQKKLVSISEQGKRGDLGEIKDEGLADALQPCKIILARVVKNANGLNAGAKRGFARAILRSG